MTYAAPNFAHIVHKPMPKNEIAFELEPLAQSHRGFESRLPPVTEADHIAADRARNAFKADQRFFAARDHFALCEEVQRDRSWA